MASSELVPGVRITGELLKNHSSTVEETEYLDLSGKEIYVLERLSACKRLQTLILSGNHIEAVQNVDCCRQLWNLDLSGNKVRSLYGLSRFPVLGAVHLRSNDLDWQELHRISHITILNLTLICNSKLDSDPHYRRHVVDMLPNVWMLDGRLITANERKNAEHFFNLSQASLRPVRRKTLESVFMPTSLKNLFVNGVFGDKTTHMMSRFPISYIHNIDMDKKRLSYLIYTIQEDIKLIQFHSCANSSINRLSTTSEQTHKIEMPRKKHHPIDLQSLFDHREKEMEQCNMLLLLLLAGLEYSIPFNVMNATLEIAKITAIGNVHCADLFSLPCKTALDVASLLLSAATIDRQEKKEGGLYEQLYKSLCYTMETVQKKLSGSTRKDITGSKQPKLQTGDSNKNKANLCCLLASEVVHLMCLVPLFFDSLQASEGLMKMTTIATRDSNVSSVINSIVWRVRAKKGDVWDVYHNIASYLLQATNKSVLGRKKVHSNFQRNIHRTTSQLMQSNVSHHLPRSMSAGSISKAKSRRLLKSAMVSRGLKEPELGDLVLLSPEKVARIVSLPEPRVAVLQFCPHSATLSSGHPDAFFHVNTHNLTWEQYYNFWTIDSLAADFSNSHLSNSTSLTTLPTLASITSLGSCTNTPEHGIPRPQSALSIASDDLQTIPSQVELVEVGNPSSNDAALCGTQFSPKKTDVGSLGTTPSVASITSDNSSMEDHHKHVLQQYSINKLKTNHDAGTERHKLLSVDNTSPLSPRSQALQDLQKSTKHAVEDGVFTIPTPQLQFAEMWEGGKSVPTISLSYKSHSCKRNELNRQNLKMEPHMSPTDTPIHFRFSSRTLLPSASPSSGITSNNSGSSYFPSHDMPILYDAWTVTMPNSSTKHSSLSSSRLIKRQQPKAPPVTTNQFYKGRSGSSTYAILRNKQVNLQPAVQVNSYGGKSIGKKHPPKAIKGMNVRRLGRTKSQAEMFVGGASIR